MIARSILVAISLCVPTVASAQSLENTTVTPAQVLAQPPQVSGSANEAFVPPFPVRFLNLTIENEPVRMAFMDVAPTANANGRSVVLLHGKNFYGDYWGDTAKFLAAQGYRVIVPDQLGFGRSSKPDIAYSFDLLARNTAQLLDELKIERATIVGHSMGGMLAVRFARDYPSRTEKLVLDNPIGLEDYRFKVPPQTTQQWYQSEISNTDPAKITAFYQRYFATPNPKWDTLALPRIAVTRSGEFPRWATASALTYQMIMQQPVRHEFSLLKVPTLLIIGQEDRTAVGKNLVSADVAKTMGQYPQLGRTAQRDIPNSQLVELPNIGHIPHLEAPEKFRAALLNFLKK